MKLLSEPPPADVAGLLGRLAGTAWLPGPLAGSGPLTVSAQTPVGPRQRSAGAQPEPPPSGSKPAARNLLDDALKPFIDQALTRRSARRLNEPDWPARIDEGLNRTRLNFVLFGYSEEHGETYEATGGSPTLFSYDLATGLAASVSFTRDLYVPELRGRLNGQPEVMRHVFLGGGFPLMRAAIEDATGLIVDFQAILRDTVLYGLIVEVTGPVAVDVPRRHNGADFRFGGQSRPGGVIEAGRQEMDGLTAMAYLESEDRAPAGRLDDRSYRKAVLYAAIAEKMRAASADPRFILKLKDFVQRKVASGELLLDFAPDLANAASESAVSVLGALLVHGAAVELALPRLAPGQTLVISDPQFGDPGSGVSRVFEIKQRAEGGLIDAGTGRPDNPFRVTAAETFPDWVQLADGQPFGSDPARDYWPSVRHYVESRLARHS